MALPSGHAASTDAFPYLTFFTSVIFCQGSMPAEKIWGNEVQYSHERDRNKENAFPVPIFQSWENEAYKDNWIALDGWIAQSLLKEQSDTPILQHVKKGKPSALQNPTLSLVHLPRRSSGLSIVNVGVDQINEDNLPNPSTSNVYWYTRSIHKYGRSSFSTPG